VPSTSIRFGFHAALTAGVAIIVFSVVQIAPGLPSPLDEIVAVWPVVVLVAALSLGGLLSSAFARETSAVALSRVLFRLEKLAHLS
jgi:hypothetical protein